MKFGYVVPNNMSFDLSYISLSEFSLCPIPFYHLIISRKIQDGGCHQNTSMVQNQKVLSKSIKEINLALKLGTLGRFFRNA
jgi:hypothetical protein